MSVTERHRATGPAEAAPPDGLPSSIHAEESVLGSMMLSPGAITDVMAVVEAEDFYWSAHQTIYEAIQALVARGDPVDTITVVEELKRRGKLNEADGHLGILELVEGVITPVSASHHAKIVANHAVLRRTMIAAGRVIAEAGGGQVTSEAWSEMDRVRDGGRGEERLTQLDWRTLKSEGLPEIVYLREPHVPAQAFVLAVGPAESGKSMWALWVVAELSRAGHDVAYFSGENPLAEDCRRLDRLQPDWDHLRFFRDQDIDLADPHCVAAVIAETIGCALIVFDTSSAYWSGEEIDNTAVAALHRDAISPIIRKTGATVVLLDHTGHEPQQGRPRRGPQAARGASTKGQKADVVLLFSATGDSTFRITHEKNRLGGRKAPAASYAVVDTDDGGLSIAESCVGTDAVTALADEMVAVIAAGEGITSKDLRSAVGGSKAHQGEAMQLLRDEEPRRVSMTPEKVETNGGKQPAKVWRLAEDSE
jgi:hypothetical protein